MADQVSDKVFRIGLPIPFPLKTVNVFFIADRPGTLIDTGLKTDASFEALKEGMKAIGFTLRSILHALGPLKSLRSFPGDLRGCRPS
jgi:glyoxylase-like metal-dependent hydrolase (beta-lactamase superfamily II)